MDTWTVFGLGLTVGLVLLLVFGTRWLFRINEQTFYLKQIYEQLMKLNADKK